MPVHFAGRDMNHIPDLELLRLFTFGADQARAKSDCQDLASFVFVPEGASPWREAHVVSHAIGSLKNGIHVDSAREGLSWRARVGTRFMSCTYQLHRDDDNSYV